MTKQHLLWWVKAVIHLLALTPITLNYYWSITDQNGADPVKAIIHFTGIGALNLLIITLMVSLIAKYFKKAWFMQTRRLIGLYCFFYAATHVLNFWWFELNFQFTLFIEELVKRPYIWLGMSGFVILFVLAVTSPFFAKRKLGKNWQLVHNWIYPASLLVWIHFYWSRKADITEPLIYLLIILSLLWFKRDKIGRWLKPNTRT
ncbi:protein-methionine-sulfoxide reductase heme-binding subunit MsrQ [Catenovulum adriaticum]|uniref:Protein-methionine-sulfoxide reductase heme-binding subunit MsrQ n=1 Tax=Catenovulum adriaticum TaxID=2984846 RepID=A0ABY7AP44_9ALTE|nr:protein-methionine-sulfoxide reductase heme-binding subunit MsrQ [Catenovulum sp. TS8]WAJ71343.1 protein-methionine-sulfoxide reductase heme-binding subunit MsrQ [Catenovulum sp. TS8]